MKVDDSIPHSTQAEARLRLSMLTGKFGPERLTTERREQHLQFSNSR